MEDHLVGDLGQLGYNAWSSLSLYGRNGFEKLDSMAAYQKLKNDSVDAVVTIVLLNKTKEKYRVPDRKFNFTSGNSESRLWNYYSTMHGRVNSQEYYEELTKYFWESNFYDLERQQLIYSVRTESFDPISAAALGHEYGQMIVNNMVMNKVLSDQHGKLKPL